MFKKSDLKNGMVMILDNGAKCSVLLGTDKGDIVAGEKDWFPLNHYSDEGLFGPMSMSKRSAVKILKPRNNKEYGQKEGEIIWNRSDMATEQSTEQAIIKEDNREKEEKEATIRMKCLELASKMTSIENGLTMSAEDLYQYVTKGTVKK